jgi:hypothetical protein
MHAVAWFLPAIKGIQSWGLNVPFPGWAAFLLASRTMWPGSDTPFETWYATALAGASVVMTVLFILASPWIVFRGSRSFQRVCAWIAAAAFILDTHWWVLPVTDRSDLGVGYFLWWWSFAMLSVGLLDLARQGGHGHSVPQDGLGII